MLARVRELCITGAGSDPETPYGCGRGAVLTADALMEPTLSGSFPETPYGCGRGAVLTSDAPMEPTLSGDLPGTPDAESVDNELKEVAFQ
ncbi:hypothetical protein MRX96_029882 [Rhipicephalus microplus]